MKQAITFLVLSAALLLTGCGNLSPRLDQEIDNQKGRIENLESIQNGFKNEIGNLQQRNELQDSQIGQMQQGIANFQSNYQNSGVQILSGPGGLLITALGIVSMFFMVAIVFHYRGVALKSSKANDILAKEIINKKDEQLVDNVFKAAMYTDVESTMVNIFRKHQ